MSLSDRILSVSQISVGHCVCLRGWDVRGMKILFPCLTLIIMKDIPVHVDPVQPCAQMQVHVARFKVPPFMQLKEHATNSQRGANICVIHNTLSTLQLQASMFILNLASCSKSHFWHRIPLLTPNPAIKSTFFH